MKLKFLTIALLLTGATISHAQVVEREDTLSASKITSEKVRRNDSATQTGLQRIDKKLIDRGFAIFNSPDVIKTLQTLPGVAAGTELISGLYVHGGDGTDNLFLLDGVPIYQVSHLVGLFSSFNSDVIDELDFYKSGFPARYGGKMSSIVDVKTRDGDFENYHGNFSLGLIDGHFQFEGPIFKGKTSFNIGLRRTWSEVFTIPALAYANKREIREYGKEDADHYNIRYNFDDFNARITHRFTPDNTIALNFYAGKDKLPISVRMSDHDIIDNQKHYGEDSVNGKLEWGNILASANWNYKISERTHSELTAYYSRNHNVIDATIKEWEWMDGKNIYNTIGESVTADVTVTGASYNMNFRPSESNHMRFGALAQYKAYDPERTSMFDIVSAGPYKNTETNSNRYTAAETALFAEDELFITPWLKANLGVRGAGFFVNGKNWLKLEPRASLKFQCTGKTDIRLSYTEMNQFDHSISTMYLDLPTNTWMPSTEYVKPMFSRQFAGGIYSQANDGLKLTLEGWYKTMDHMYEYNGKTALYPEIDHWEMDFAEGKGKSWGLEAGAEYEKGPLMLSAYYTLSWSRRMFEDFYFDWYPDRNDNRHKIDLMANYNFNKKFELYAGWHYHTGSRVTAASYSIKYDTYNNWFWGADIYDKPNNLKLPDYHRLDLGFNFTRTTRHGNTAVWNLSVYNAYCRMNAIYGYITEEYEEILTPEGSYELRPTGKKYGEAVGIIPIIPTLGYTLKF